MSVILVQKELTDIMVTALVDGADIVPEKGRSVIFGPSQQQIDEKREECNEAGQRLWAINYESSNNRYNEKKETPAYVFEPRPMSPARVLAAVDVYEYQISEATSPDTYEACNTLRRRMTRKLPDVVKARAEIHEYV